MELLTHKWESLTDWDEFYKKIDPFNVYKKGLSIGEKNKLDDLIISIGQGGRRFLDIGCGEGYFTNFFSIFFDESCGSDISRTAINRANALYGKDITFFMWDISNSILKEFDNFYDCVLVSEVLYYIDPTKLPLVSENICRLVSPQGKLIISIGHEYTESHIVEIFPSIEWYKCIKIPGDKGIFSLLMEGKPLNG